jgi:hypothetical protein
LQEPGAVVRRMNFPYKVRVVSDYALPEGKLDYAKFAAALKRCSNAQEPIDRFPWFIWEAAKHDFLSGMSDDTWVPMRDVIKHIAADLRQRQATFTSTKDSLSAFVSGYAGLDGGSVEHQGPFLDRMKSYFDGQMNGGFLAKFKEGLETFLDEAKGYASEYLRVFGVVGGFAIFGLFTIALRALLLFIFDLVCGLFGKKSRPVAQSNRPLLPKQPKNLNFQSFDSQVVDNVYANTYKMTLQVGFETVSIGQLCFLSGSLAVVPAHFRRVVNNAVLFRNVDSSTVVTFRNCNQ